MRELGAIVRVLGRVMVDQRHEFPMGDTVASQLVGHQTKRFWALTLQQCANELSCRTAVPTGLNEDVDHIAALIHGAPEILSLTVDGDEDLVQETKYRRDDPDVASIDVHARLRS